MPLRGLCPQPCGLAALLCCSLLGSIIALFSLSGRSASRCLLPVSKLTGHSELSELPCFVAQKKQYAVDRTYSKLLQNQHSFESICSWLSFFFFFLGGGYGGQVGWHMPVVPAFEAEAK